VQDDVLELIAKRISSNVRALEGALVKAIAYAELEGQPLTPRSIEGVLPKEGRRPRLTVLHIKEEVASHYQIPVTELDGASRKKEIAQARQVAIFLAREMTELSFPSIGRRVRRPRSHHGHARLLEDQALGVGHTPTRSGHRRPSAALESRYSLIR